MPNHPSDQDQIQEPVRIAMEMYNNQQAWLKENFLSPETRQYNKLIGDTPAEPLLPDVLMQMDIDQLPSP